MRIPADIDREDPLVFGLSARQLCILTAAAAIAWLFYAVAIQVAPTPIAAAAAAPFVAAGAAVALVRRDGITGDRFVLSVLRHLRSPHRLVPTSDDDVPARARSSFDGSLLAPLQLPIRDIANGGLLDLGPDGVAMLVRVDPVNFTLRTSDEQAAFIGAYARFLNSLRAPIQVVVRSERADLGRLADEVRRAAPSLRHPTLEVAARSHATFLSELSQRHTILHREVLLALRFPASHSPESAESLADTTCAALAEVGLAVVRLDGGAAGTALQVALTGELTQLGEVTAPGEVIRGSRMTDVCD
jgi:hypothetical protein